MAIHTAHALEPTPPGPDTAGMERLRLRGAQAMLILLYAAAWGAVALLPLNQTDFDVFFLPAARIALAGHPLHIYTVRFDGPYPDANGPLAIAPLTVVAWVIQRLGWMQNVQLRRMVVMAVFSLFALLLSREALNALDAMLPRPLTRWGRLGAYAVIALSPALWHAVLLYGHIELPIMLAFVLFATRSLGMRRVIMAGIALGLAILTRSMAVLYLMGLVMVELRWRRWRDAAILGLGAVATTIAGLLPFWLADAHDVAYSLVQFRDSLPVSGGSIWAFAIGTPLRTFAQMHDSLVVVIAAAIIISVTLLIRRDIDVRTRDIYALLLLSEISFPLFIKTLWPYYFLGLYVFAALWWLLDIARLQRGEQRVWRWLLGALIPVLAVAGGVLGEAGVTSSLSTGTWQNQWSVAECANLLLMLGLAWWWLSRERKPGATARSGAIMAEEPSRL